ncbi:MAG: transporter substrate-binding domain-containing protein [Candidatus Krumholzibacteriia bacterium]
MLALLAPQTTARAAEQAAGPALRSGCEIDYPPFCVVHPDGSADGFSVELMRESLARMGRTVTFATGTWSEVRGLLERGEVDALPLVGRTPEREHIFDFTVPYMTLHGAIVVRKGTEGIGGLADLAGRTVAVMAGDNAEEFLGRGDRGLVVHTTPTFEQALQELAAGRHDAVVMQRLVALRLLRAAGLEDLQILDQPVTDFRQDFCFAVREGDSQTLALLNEGLALVMADGTYRHLHHKWFAALELPSDRRLMVGGDWDYPPYEYLDAEGWPAGYNVELTRAVAREVGLEIEIRLGPWSEMRDALLEGRIDALQGMFYSPERDLEYDLSQPHSVNHCVGVVRRGAGPPPADVEDLRDLRLVAQHGDIMHEYAVAAGLGARLTTVSSQREALADVRAGRADCALVSRLTALYWIGEQDWQDLQVGRKPLISPDYCFAVRNGELALLAQFSEGLKLLEASGEYRRIRERWLGVYRDEGPIAPETLRRAAAAVAALGAVLLVVLAWSWSLRRQVAARTAEVRRSEEYLRSLLACSPVALYSIDRDGNVQTWNSSAEQVFGWTEAEVSGRPLPIVPDDRRDEFAASRQRLLGGEGFVGVEVVRRRKDGGLFTGRLSTAPIRDSAGAIVGVMGAMEDITERRRDEQRILHLNRVLLAIREVSLAVHEADDPAALIGAVCRGMVDNGSYRAALIVLVDGGGAPAEWAQAGLATEVAAIEEDLGAGRLPAFCRLADGVPEGEPAVVAAGDCTVCGSDGHALCIALGRGGVRLGYLTAALPAPLADDAEERRLFAEMAGEIAHGLQAGAERSGRLRAEQEREDLQRQLLQAQKMEAVGQLAGGVAHDFNNILQAMMGYTQILIDEATERGEDTEELAQIAKGVERATALTRQLLAFSRRQVMQPESLDLNLIVENLLKLLRRVIGEHIRLEWIPGSNLGLVLADAGMLEQVLMNFCVNARDAMPGGGVLNIETQNVRVDADYCAHHTWARPGRYVLLSVTDNGCGIAPADLERIFEPFFTTKEEGKGTGLGLATVYGIVKQHDGMISAYSEPGEGTTFKVYLPITELPAAGVGRLIEGPVRGGDEVDLLLLDVVMPRLGGHEVHKRIRERRPDLPVVFCSGYSANAVHTDFVLHEGLRLLQKPYATAELLRAVRAAIDRTGPPPQA